MYRQWIQRAHWDTRRKVLSLLLLHDEKQIQLFELPQTVYVLLRNDVQSPFFVFAHENASDVRATLKAFNT